MSFWWCVVFSTVWAQSHCTDKHWSPSSRRLMSEWNESQCSLWQSRHLCSHTAVIVFRTSQPGHNCWPAGSVEHFGLMSASTWEGLCSQQGGGDLCVTLRGFSMFLWWWEYCSTVILLAHCATRISFLFWLLHFFLFGSRFGFLIVYCLCYHWNISTYQSVSWRHIILPPWNPPSAPTPALFLSALTKYDTKCILMPKSQVQYVSCQSHGIWFWT